MDIHFNSYKVKYQLLSSFFRPIAQSQHIKKINIFVSIDDLFRLLHKPIINNEFQLCGINAGKQLLSNIFNLLGHYRNWAIKEGYSVKVYGIYTSNLRKFKNSMYVDDYRQRFSDNNDPNSPKYFFINDAIRSALPLLPVISNYIPGVYLIDSKYTEPSVIPLYIATEVDSADWNILISRDTYDLQFAYKDKWSYISPKGDNSISVTRKNMWEYLNTKEHIFKESREYPFDTSLYVIARALVGDPYRGIPRLRKIGWKTLFKYLDMLLEEERDFSKVSQQNKLITLLTDKKVSMEDCNNNIYCIDLEKQLETMMEIDKVGILSQLQDIEDYENLKVMTNTMFQKYPLNLAFLCNQNYRRSAF